MHVLCLSRNQPWYVRPTLVSKSFCFALIFSVNHLLRRRSNPFSRTICPFLLTRQNTLRYDCQYGIGCMRMEKKAETWYVPPCITAFLYHFLQFSEEPARSRMHPHSDGKSIKKDEKKAMLAGLDLSRLLALFSLVSSFLVHLSLGQSRILCPINLGHQLLHDEMSRLEKMMMCILLANTF